MKMRRETPYRMSSDLHAGGFERGRSYANWRPRGSEDYLLIYTAAGAGFLTTTKASGATRPGDVTLYALGEAQDSKTDAATGHWRLLWAHFVPKPSWKPWLRWPRGEHGVMALHLEKGEIRERFEAAMERTIGTFRRRLPFSADFGANALEEALLWAHVTAMRGEWTRTDPRVRRAIDYLIANLRAPFQLEAVARHCGLSVSRLAHLFKAGTGTSPQQYFEQQRLWHAGQLLRVTGLGIGEIANEVGYDDPFYFSNRFRRYAGKSPTEFRQERKSDRD
jgi:AraC family transcriptional regulator of arabinose operon